MVLRQPHPEHLPSRRASPCPPTLEPLAADYTFSIVRITEPAPAHEIARPAGVGLTAFALAALVAVDLIRGSLQLSSGTLAPALIFEQVFAIFGRGVELLLLWHYWRGQNWSRIFVLLWSFFIAARALSALIDRASNLTSLMSEPLSFFHLLLALWLLYWLNTRALRAWFKKMSATAADLIAEHLSGKLCTAVDKPSGDLWRLSFEHGAELTLACPWRIALDDNLAFASRAPEPRDEQDEARRLLQNIRVKSVRVAPRTSDLFLSFEMGIELQTWSTDPDSHQWTYSDPALTVTADAASLAAQLSDASAPPHAS